MSLILDVLSWILLCTGGFFCITAGVGLIRMPDFYTRAHASSILDSMGAGLVLFGLALQAPNYIIALKLLFIFFFLMITGLAAIHALAQTVNVAGVNPELADIVQRLNKNTGEQTQSIAETLANSEEPSEARSASIDTNSNNSGEKK